jgi:serine/threonine-protein kinase TTK/MPS1
VFEAEPPAVKDLLAPDETVINPYYMRQLLQYGIKLGEAQSSDMSPETLLREAEVCAISLPYRLPFLLLTLGIS